MILRKFDVARIVKEFGETFQLLELIIQYDKGLC